ncbi:MAG: TRAP transporter large permease [Oscillospiraceae bacterium]|nr:TRAP transporter large permease [Oscillospiraceae bacterium]
MLFEFELIIIIAMVGTVLLLNLGLRLPSSVAMIAGAVVGSIVAGEGVAVRHIFEGCFAFLDTSVLISTAMIMMFVIRASGTFEALGAVIIKAFHKHPMFLLYLLMFVVMFPGMITGTASIGVLCAAGIVVPVMTMMGYSKVKIGAFLATGATLGMIAPPVNSPAMMIASMVDMSFRGFTGPLLFISGVVSVIFVTIIGWGKVKPIDLEEAKQYIDFEIGKKYGFKIYLPLLYVILHIAAVRAFPRIFPDLGNPLVFTIGTIVALFTGRKVDLIKTASTAMEENVSVIGKLMAIGSFLQVFVFVGARGYVVTNCVTLPVLGIALACLIIMPLFGGISVYGSASLFGPPLVLAMLGGEEIIMAAALSALAILGELMPPSALAANYAASVVDESYKDIMKECALTIVMIIVVAFLCLQFSSQLSFLV